MTTSSIAYHEQELRVALDPSSPQRLMPDPGAATRILDVGCGAGQTMAAMAAGGRAIGVDIDLAALRLAARRPVAGSLRVAVAQGERLPFGDAAFDFVYSRVALPYMDIPSAIAEMHRVLRPGGRLWLALHPLSMPLEQFRRGNLKGKVHAAYIIANGLWFHLTGRTFRLTSEICESIQTRRGMRVALTRAGFTGIAFRRTPIHFIVEARRVSI